MTLFPKSYPFIKAMALGNDFVILDARQRSIPLTRQGIQKIAHRRGGIGCDQVIVMLSPKDPATDVYLRFYNADGSEAEACGNGVRCTAKIILETRGQDTLIYQTSQTTGRATYDRQTGLIAVTMGQPRFAWNEIPLAQQYALKDVSYQGVMPIAVNVGNPHIVFFGEDVSTVPLSEVGPAFESHDAFPHRINVSFAAIHSRNALRLRVWERGSGDTGACGTGACAAAVAALDLGHVSSPVRVIQSGGELEIQWKQGEDIIMTGPAEIVYCGEYLGTDA